MHLIATRRAKVRRVDWRGYWINFNKVHGLHPVVYRSKLLYADGWQYGLAADYSGPEYPAPSAPDEVRALVVVYYKMRKFASKKMAIFLQEKIDDVVALHANRSLPLVFKGPEVQEFVIPTMDGDEPIKIEEGSREHLEMWLQQCHDDVGYCKQKLEQMGV